jgi:hypothetical protein
MKKIRSRKSRETVSSSLVWRAWVHLGHPIHCGQLRDLSKGAKISWDCLFKLWCILGENQRSHIGSLVWRVWVHLAHRSHCGQLRDLSKATKISWDGLFKLCCIFRRESKKSHRKFGLESLGPPGTSYSLWTAQRSLKRKHKSAKSYLFSSLN